MYTLLDNWRTGLTGLAALLTALGHMISHLSAGDTSTLVTDVPAILAAIGLIFAEDAR